MVNSVSGNANMVAVMGGLKQGPKAIGQERLPDPDVGNTAELAASAIGTAVEHASKTASIGDVKLTQRKLEDDLRSAMDNFQNQIGQIKAASIGGKTEKPSTEMMARAPANGTTDASLGSLAEKSSSGVESASTTIKTLLASMATPADVNGNGKVTSFESITYAAKQASLLTSPGESSKSAVIKPTEQLNAQAAQAYERQSQEMAKWNERVGDSVLLVA